MENTQAETRYSVTKVFTSGILAGLSVTEVTGVSFPSGFVCANPVAGDPYIITHIGVVPGKGEDGEKQGG